MVNVPSLPIQRAQRFSTPPRGARPEPVCPPAPRRPNRYVQPNEDNSSGGSHLISTFLTSLSLSTEENTPVPTMYLRH